MNKYIIRFELEEGKTTEEVFDTEKAAIDYLQDQYNSWCADDEAVAEGVFYPLLTAATQGLWEKEGNNFILEN